MISLFFESIGFIVLQSFLFLHHNCDDLSQFVIMMLGIFFMPFPNPPSTLLHPAPRPERRISWTRGTGALVQTGRCPPRGLGNLCLSLVEAAFGPKEFLSLSLSRSDGFRFHPFPGNGKSLPEHWLWEEGCADLPTQGDGFASTSPAVLEASSFAASSQQLKAPASHERSIVGRSASDSCIPCHQEELSPAFSPWWPQRGAWAWAPTPLVSGAPSFPKLI